MLNQIRIKKKSFKYHKLYLYNLFDTNFELRKLVNFPFNKSTSTYILLLIYLLETSTRHTAFLKSSKEVPKLTHPCAFPVSLRKISNGFNGAFGKCL